MKKENKRKRGWRILVVLLIILVVVIAAVITVGIWQKNNIEAVKLYMTHSQDDIESQIAQNDEYLNELLEKYLNGAQFGDETSETESAADTAESDTEAVETDSTEVAVVTDETAPPECVSTSDGKTHEETSEIKETESTVEAVGSSGVNTETTAIDTEVSLQPPSETKAVTEAVTDAVTDAVTQAVTEAVTETAVSETPKAPATLKLDMSAYEEELKVLIGEVYTLREEYIAELDGLYAEVVAAYKAVPKDEWTSKKLATFINEYFGKGTALERECDSRMDDLIKKFRTLTKKYGQSTEIIDSVKYAYAREKSLKKAWYMSELERRGFI